MAHWPIHYILVGRTPIAVDLKTWADKFSNRVEDWRVGLDHITDACHVSTVFMGLNHSIGRSDPILFETMIFGGPLDGYQQRYRTYDEAERGHAEAVMQARIACAQIKAIADATGAA